MKPFESIRRAVVTVSSLTVLACNPAGPPPSSARTQTRAPTADPPPARPQPETGPAPVATATAGAGPLFAYVQDGHTVEFTSPNLVHFQRGSRAWRSCRTKLGEDGNMWTGPDVEAAFVNAEVTRALESESAFQVDGANAKLTATGYPGSLSWTSKCANCPAEPPGVKHFREVMQTVTANRDAVCK